jgi:lipoate synthase
VHVEAGPLVRSSYHAATQEAAAAQQEQIWRAP